MAHLNLGRGNNPGSHKKQAFLDPIRVIHLKQPHGCSTIGCERLDATSLKTKVLCPTIAARVKEWSNGPTLRVD